MFERSKKDTDTIESQDANRSEPSKTFGSLRSKVTGGGDAAVIGRSIQINGDLRGNEDLRIEGDVSRHRRTQEQRPDHRQGRQGQGRRVCEINRRGR